MDSFSVVKNEETKKDANLTYIYRNKWLFIIIAKRSN